MSLLFILDMVGTVAFAAAGILGAILLVVLTRIEYPEQLNLLLVAGSVILVRVLAIRYNWSLPKARTQ